MDYSLKVGRGLFRLLAMKALEALFLFPVGLAYEWLPHVHEAPKRLIQTCTLLEPPTSVGV